MFTKNILIWFLQVLLNVGDTWLGATDAVRERTWIWDSSKTTMTYSKWNGGEPNNSYPRENCLCYWTGNGNWNDLSCDASLATMCELNFRCWKIPKKIKWQTGSAKVDFQILIYLNSKYLLFSIINLYKQINWYQQFYLQLLKSPFFNYCKIIWTPVPIRTIN